MSPGGMALMLVIVLVFLTGAQCTVNGSTGGGGRVGRAEAEAESSSGRVAGCSASCLKYSTGSERRPTGHDGEFSVSSGARVRFFVGDLPLGDEVQPKDPMTPVDLIEDGSVESPAVLNLTRLLMSFDSTPEKRTITISENVHRKLVRSNEDLAPWIDSMQFEDEARFLNAASQLLAACADEFPYTPSLVDKDRAKRWLLSLQ